MTFSNDDILSITFLLNCLILDKPVVSITRVVLSDNGDSTPEVSSSKLRQIRPNNFRICSGRMNMINILDYRVCIKYCVLLQEFSQVCHLSLASTRLLLVVQKNTSQQEWLYTCITLRALKVSYSDVGEGGVAVNCEKTQFLMNTLYYLVTNN